MRMPDKIDNAYFAPCGMNCMVCYRHCMVKKPCAGCLSGEDFKPEHCRKCKIKDCAREKGLTHCFECVDFPCKLVANLERSYNRRYGASLVENSLFVREHGLAAFMAGERQKYLCPNCGGVISLHDRECGECRTKV